MKVRLDRSVMLYIANKFDRLADILLKPDGEVHLHKMILGAAGHGEIKMEHPTPGYVYINAYVVIDMDNGVPLVFECKKVDNTHYIEGAYPRQFIARSKREPIDEAV